jgi:hypothetical protein
VYGVEKIETWLNIVVKNMEELEYLSALRIKKKNEKKKEMKNG